MTKRTLVVFLFFFQMLSLRAEGLNNQYFLGIRRNQGRTVGVNRSYTTLESLSFPVRYKNFWPFVDLRGHYFDHGKFAANAGIGGRFLLPNFNQVLGLNAYYDYRQVSHHNFNQLGLGLEWLGSFLNFRLNGYLPLGKRKFLKSSCFHEYEGGYFVLIEEFDKASSGVDFEIEAHLLKMAGTDLYFAVGPYYYTGNKCRANFYGAQAYLRGEYNSRIFFGVNGTYDHINKTRVQAELAWRFPISLPYQQTQLFEPVRRREMIVRESYCRWHYNF